MSAEMGGMSSKMRPGVSKGYPKRLDECARASLRRELRLNARCRLDTASSVGVACKRPETFPFRRPELLRMCDEITAASNARLKNKGQA